ncbi:hypothetical protein [Phaffia rhodozyma]|uniref:Thioesterase/thiol ester dehydrase-isomerase n=1 Tax=Phaffia rhodozyma TaxID=264483 RepID=A0A0F7SVM4_PHARH|nr:hypothetical protein [Phaffia rhodozyma]
MPADLAARRMPSSEPSVMDLLEQFKNPHSPMYLPPGTCGPADEGDITPNYTIPLPTNASASTSLAHIPPTANIVSSEPPLIKYDRPLTGWPDTTYSETWMENRKTILERAVREGWDVERAAFELPIAWGHVDKFRHLNNVHYLRYFETARLGFIQSLSSHIPASKVTDLLEGQNTGFVIKSHNIVYKAPITHPDSLIVLARPKSVSMPSSFHIEIAAWSLKTEKLVATCETECVVYDHNLGQKAAMTDDIKHALLSRMNRGHLAGGNSKI